ncbi:unnamed protein product [Clonostachys solani]|uniref:Uncharacterized protein n=1 Tax=Clonostachys solani TaxID=160281 RepID=A0A9N9ZBD2_9HYPO|nr:unnamed protein product [Clonostachys solani]
MDHFNATVHNGALVSTRKGLYISKSKHQGIRFVNAFATDASSSASSTSPETTPTSTPIPSAIATDSASGSSPTFAVTPTPTTTVTASTTSAAAEHADSSFSADIAQASQFFTDLEVDGEIGDSFDVDMGGSTMERRPGYEGSDRPHFFDIAITPPAASSPSPGRSSTPNSIKNAGGSRYGRPDEPNTPVSVDDEHGGRKGSTSSSQGVGSVPSLTQRIASQYLSNLPPQSHIYDAIAMVASLATGASRGREVSSEELGASIANVCASMNRNILAGDDDGRRTLPVVMESIAAMAIDGIFTGQQQHWHILMKGLRDLHDRIGGLKPEWGGTLNKIRKADVKGAVYTGTSPYLEFEKYFPSVSDSLPAQLRAEVTSNMRTCLQGSRISQLNIDSFQALALFTQTVVHARQASNKDSSFALDFQGFAEDCLRVEYQVARYPRSLRDDIAQADQAFAALGVSELNPDVITRGRAHSPSPLTPETTDPERNLMNAVLRSAALLYIEDLLPDSHSVDLCIILLRALSHQLGNIVLAMGHRLTSPESTPTVNRVLPSLEAMRPVLLWSCMVGYALTQFLTQTRSASLDRSPFEHCVGLLLLGPGAPKGGLSEKDMKLGEILPVRAIRSVSSDEGTLLRQMVAGYEAKQLRGKQP